ncbi:hypothetical protein LSTR_LSTR014875 [Laodelphax striatellus]|uniref:Uncharacterized protein n=1 Tax=Laodelphax striatellus TaxID=195883 RepID=A0A482WKK8_LAOST|nr:hypothetical protein LSTR_LSTR014875 [Laodelphax striatellus]
MLVYSMDSIGAINARYRRMINLANPQSSRDAVNLNTCKDMIEMWLPKKRDKGTSQVFTSLNESVLTDMMDPISATDGVNKQYLEKRMNEHSREVVGKVLTVMVTLVMERANGINSLDRACKQHDIAYSRNSDTSSRAKADRELAERAWSVATSADAGVLEKAAAVAVTNINEGQGKVWWRSKTQTQDNKNSWTQKGEEIL